MKRDTGPTGSRYARAAPHNVTLQKDRNVIVAKVICASDNRWRSGIFASLLDQDGKALDGIRVTRTLRDSES